ncbi:Hypothetical protein D9617_18g032630 [Elsinoe fawcettii]|nr:Hypothetical protein D9617_18g032630 [Elsinoe fawcettii]
MGDKAGQLSGVGIPQVGLEAPKHYNLADVLCLYTTTEYMPPIEELLRRLTKMRPIVVWATQQYALPTPDMPETVPGENKTLFQQYETGAMIHLLISTLLEITSCAPPVPFGMALSLLLNIAKFHKVPGNQSRGSVVHEVVFAGGREWEIMGPFCKANVGLFLVETLSKEEATAMDAIRRMYRRYGFGDDSGYAHMEQVPAGLRIVFRETQPPGSYLIGQEKEDHVGMRIEVLAKYQDRCWEYDSWKRDKEMPDNDRATKEDWQSDAGHDDLPSVQRYGEGYEDDAADRMDVDGEEGVQRFRKYGRVQKPEAGSVLLLDTSVHVWFSDDAELGIEDIIVNEGAAAASNDIRTAPGDIVINEEVEFRSDLWRNAERRGLLSPEEQVERAYKVSYPADPTKRVECGTVDEYGDWVPDETGSLRYV